MRPPRSHLVGSAAVAALPFLSSNAIASSVVELGNASLSVVSDGNLVLPVNFIASPEFPADQLEAFLKENALDTNSHEPACNVSLWQQEDRLVLFDVGAGSRLEILQDRIKLFNYGDEVAPGIEAVDSSGHTPGHTSFALHSGSDSIMVLGDAITHPIISFQKHEWPSGGDQDQEQARLTRAKLLDRMAQDKMRVLGFHLPHPGVGYAERDGAAYRFVAG